MSRKKGLSLEEKRERMVTLLQEKQDFFQLKELEKLAPKEKGIIAQSVKDVIQSLVDDGLVESDKIGTSVYFWSFPTKAANTKKRKLEDVTNSLADIQQKRQKLKDVLDQAKVHVASLVLKRRMSRKKGLSLEEKRERMVTLLQEKQDFFQLKELEKLAPKEKGIIAQSVKDVIQSLVDDGLVESDKIGTSVYFWSFPTYGVPPFPLSIFVLADDVIIFYSWEVQVAREAANRWLDNILSVKSWCRNRFNIDEAVLNKQFGIPEDMDYLDT
ncbi:unnamed protein product [Darwinula stevensoni]|uniref:Meiotic nuclear division protein 1 homolog n=1 Tax=Darwinula stevensoni TaxID=69355 RepID=A0A7R8XGJ9_9CRUS|nr:unnamed protein product [Darwinula stevensoni]CAG0891761.1 unnamed protein product [Darwinula stevensoni]